MDEVVDELGGGHDLLGAGIEATLDLFQGADKILQLRMRLLSVLDDAMKFP
jgi:hypothetical protein